MTDLLRQRGFSLLELLVAFVIMALSLGMLYRASGSSARAVGMAEQNQRASMVAESVFAMRDFVGPDGWQDAGETAGYSWRVTSAPYAVPVESSDKPRLHEVSVIVSWQESAANKSFELQTLVPERKPVPQGAVR
ncbi:type II secretion system protein [Acidovorax sp. FHTAMBA]|jgi:general secretion pathway protein I|uniref:prepilin-type N-terminal cleavage/methylation domain-containing protein n=1 Tax=Acidovorax sp. FHTAMBA TaxID=3140252 RepID=UPI0015F52E5D